VLISYLGEKERKKALSNSKVKVFGKDVVASHKIICAIGMFPFYAFLFAFLYYYLIVEYVTQNSFYQFLLTISFFFLWPLYAYSIASFWIVLIFFSLKFLVLVRSVDGVVRQFKTVKAKLVFLIDTSKYSQLRFSRKTNQLRVMTIPFFIFIFLFVGKKQILFRLEILLLNMERKCLAQILRNTGFSTQMISN